MIITRENPSTYTSSKLFRNRSVTKYARHKCATTRKGSLILRKENPRITYAITRLLCFHSVANVKDYKTCMLWWRSLRSPTCMPGNRNLCKGKSEIHRGTIMQWEFQVHTWWRTAKVWTSYVTDCAFVRSLSAHSAIHSYQTRTMTPRPDLWLSGSHDNTRAWFHDTG